MAAGLDSEYAAELEAHLLDMGLEVMGGLVGRHGSRRSAGMGLPNMAAMRPVSFGRFCQRGQMSQLPSIAMGTTIGLPRLISR